MPWPAASDRSVSAQTGGQVARRSCAITLGRQHIIDVMFTMVRSIAPLLIPLAVACFPDNSHRLPEEETLRLGQHERERLEATIEAGRARVSSFLSRVQFSEPTIIVLLPHPATRLALDTIPLAITWQHTREVLRRLADSLTWRYLERSTQWLGLYYPLIDRTYNHWYRPDPPPYNGGFLLVAPGLAPVSVPGPYRHQYFASVVAPFAVAVQTRFILSTSSAVISTSPQVAA